MALHSLTCPRLWARFDGWAFRDHIGLYISRMEAEHFSTRHIYRMVRLVGEFARWLLDQHGNGSDVHVGINEMRADMVFDHLGHEAR